MKKILVLLMVMFSVIGHASDDCYGKLSKNYQMDSRHFQINIDEIPFDDEDEIERKALSYLLDEMGCDVNKVQNFKCKHVSDYEYSFVCSANIDEGYFFIAPDMLNSVNIIFNRYD